MQFHGPVKDTPYMKKLGSGKMKRVALNPNDIAIGNFNISKRYDITSGFYFVYLYSTDFDMKSERKSTSEAPDDILWTLSSKTYLIDIDVDNSKVLYSKALNFIE